MTPTRRGLTRVEVLVVLVIVVLAIGLLLPATRRHQGSASRARCQNNLKQLMLGLHGYAENAGDLRPTGADKPEPGFPSGCYGTPDREPDERLSWQVRILPYIEQETLSRQFDPNKGFTPEVAAALKPLGIFVCYGSKGYGEPVTTYVGMAGLGEDAARRREADPANGIMGYDRACALKDITDGMSNTIALAETNHALRPWAQGGPGTVRAFDAAAGFGPDGPLGSAHAKGFNVAMCDGSVRFVRFSQDAAMFAAAVTIAGGEKVELD